MRRFPQEILREHTELRALTKLSTPERIQDFLNSLPINFEKGGETCRSPLCALREKKAHCMEGAMLAAAAFWLHGERPLLLDLKTAKGDSDHVVALFKRNGLWGAVSKTNHAVLRYRDPVFRTVRELAMSYFSEYFLDSGKKTLRSHSAPWSLLRYGNEWLTTEEERFDIPADLDDSRHFPIAPQNTLRKLRRADKVEIEAGKITEWKKRS